MTLFGTYSPLRRSASSPVTDGSWDVGHLRVGAVVTGVLAVVGCPLIAVFRSPVAACCALGGLAIVAGFFSVSAFAVARAGRINDSLTLPVALSVYVAKIVALGVLLVAVRNAEWLDIPVFAASVFIGTLVWASTHCWRVWNQRIYYVQPAGPGAFSGE